MSAQAEPDWLVNSALLGESAAGISCEHNPTTVAKLW